jgi:hypothetical protein
MDVLDVMFRVAERAIVLVDLGTNGLKHRVSLYADDIAVFARPDRQELLAVKVILCCFGVASGLVVNFLKSSTAPIRSDDNTRLAVAPLLACPFIDLPMRIWGSRCLCTS